MKKFVYGVVLIFALVMGNAWFQNQNNDSSNDSHNDSQSSSNVLAKMRNPDPAYLSEKHQQRYELIQELKEKKIIYKIEKEGNYPHVYVDTVWHLLKYDDKESFMNVILAYYRDNDPSCDKALIFDSNSGKQIGTYSKYGLEMR